ncbi:12413_t:CDS:2 [Entrophospora sp. SA101]|nr:12413_t:CDS:2 [Entrophospora sp. SA101]CAJ0922789.1 5743_t:CDS:2 [Entrophospora sp. SA101]
MARSINSPASIEKNIHTIIESPDEGTVSYAELINEIGDSDDDEVMPSVDEDFEDFEESDVTEEYEENP